MAVDVRSPAESAYLNGDGADGDGVLPYSRCCAPIGSLFFIELVATDFVLWRGIYRVCTLCTARLEKYHVTLSVCLFLYNFFAL